MAHLIVKNFGAIKSAEIEIKKYNFFIGHTSSGKVLLQNFLQYLTTLFLGYQGRRFQGIL